MKTLPDIKKEILDEAFLKFVKPLGCGSHTPNEGCVHIPAMDLKLFLVVVIDAVVEAHWEAIRDHRVNRTVESGIDLGRSFERQLFEEAHQDFTQPTDER